jgi:hypothetical protein
LIVVARHVALYVIGCALASHASLDKRRRVGRHDRDEH